jgi:hypothetical protein
MEAPECTSRASQFTPVMKPVANPWRSINGPAWPRSAPTFEHYMLADDRPNDPMTPLVRLDFQGRLDRQAFPQALDSALSAHPLLRAHLHGAPDGRTTNLYWVDTSPQPPG